MLGDYQRYYNLPTIQILIFIKETLAEYYQKIKGKRYDPIEIIDLGLDFRNCCPICGGMDCALFIGYYTRVVIDENGINYNEFPIARYLCQGKGERSPDADATFSLLPYQLVPYTRYSIPFIIKILKAQHEEGLSISKFQDYLASFGQDDILSINLDQILGFKQIVLEAVHKITSTEHYEQLKEQVGTKTTDQQIVIAFIEFASGFECCKTDPSVNGASGLNYDFYLNGGGFIQNARFLFGTPYQFRKKR